MSDLFDRHSKENEVQAKAALNHVAAKTISKYVITQEVLNKALSGGGRSNKDGKCIICIVDKSTKIMSKLEGQVGQLAKVYKLMFDEEMDLDGITLSAMKEYYPLTQKGSLGRQEPTSKDKFPTDPREIAELIKSTLKNMTNDEVEVNVIDMSESGKGGSVFGINPDDYDDVKDFIKAVKEARKDAVTKALLGTKKGEDIIKEAVIHTAEETVDHISKESSSPSTNGSDKKKSSPKSDKKN